MASLARCLCLGAMLASATVFAAEEPVLTYVVKKGDTVFAVSHKFGVSVQDLKKANPDIGPGNQLKVGDRLTLPPEATPPENETENQPKDTGPEPVEKDPALVARKDDAEEKPDAKNAKPPTHMVTHTIQTGDTLAGIAHQYGVSVADIRTLNHIQENRIYVGNKLKIMVPDAEAKKTEAAPTKEAQPAVAEEPPKAAPVAVGSKPRAPEETADASDLQITATKPRSSSSGDAPRYFFINKVKDQIDGPKVTPGHWKYVVVHHSGTANGNAKIFDYYHRHERGMENGLAYHFVIGNGHDSGDGEIEVGNRWTRQIKGGHLHSEELNKISIGICFVGDFNTDRPTKKQIAACIELISYLNEKCHGLKFKAHKEINPRPTDCPGQYFPLKAFHELFG